LRSLASGCPLERGYAAQVGADRWAEVRSTLETRFGDDPHEDLSLPAAAPRPIQSGTTGPLVQASESDAVDRARLREMVNVGVALRVS
jgi:hypothetical protein